MQEVRNAELLRRALDELTPAVFVLLERTTADDLGSDWFNKLVRDSYHRSPPDASQQDLSVLLHLATKNWHSHVKKGVNPNLEHQVRTGLSLARNLRNRRAHSNSPDDLPIDEVQPALFSLRQLVKDLDGDPTGLDVLCDEARRRLAGVAAPPAPSPQDTTDQVRAEVAELRQLILERDLDADLRDVRDGFEQLQQLVMSLREEPSEAQDDQDRLATFQEQLGNIEARLEAAQPTNDSEVMRMLALLAAQVEALSADRVEASASGVDDTDAVAAVRADIAELRQAMSNRPLDAGLDQVRASLDQLGETVAGLRASGRDGHVEDLPSPSVMEHLETVTRQLQESSHRRDPALSAALADLTTKVDLLSTQAGRPGDTPQTTSPPPPSAARPALPPDAEKRPRSTRRLRGVVPLAGIAALFAAVATGYWVTQGRDTRASEAAMDLVEVGEIDEPTVRPIDEPSTSPSPSRPSPTMSATPTVTETSESPTPTSTPTPSPTPSTMAQATPRPSPSPTPAPYAAPSPTPTRTTESPPSPPDDFAPGPVAESAERVTFLDVPAAWGSGAVAADRDAEIREATFRAYDSGHVDEDFGSCLALFAPGLADELGTEFKYASSHTSGSMRGNPNYVYYYWEDGAGQEAVIYIMSPETSYFWEEAAAYEGRQKAWYGYTDGAEAVWEWWGDRGYSQFLRIPGMDCYYNIMADTRELWHAFVPHLRLLARP